MTLAVASFLGLSLILLVYALIPNSYPSYPASARGVLSAARYPSVSSLPWLHSNGRLVLNCSGQQVLLRGMNVTGPMQAKDVNPGPIPTANDFQQMQADGFDVVRIPISWSLLEPRPGVFSTSYLDLIKKVVTLAATHGIYSYSSSWTGIDGFNNSSLIQAGTEQDYVNGSAPYYAWWEILPAAETVIRSITVSPGDVVTVTISKLPSGLWQISLSDPSAAGNTSTFTTTQSYSGPGTSAEWIEEAPTVGGRVATLADYGSAPFNPGSVNGGNPALVVGDGGVMVQKRQQVSTPSLPDTDADGFNVAYGSTSPSAPQS
ncbi:MAG: G1 family glutamic endopeptidase [Candidatus Dormibacteria bacterium]